MRIESQRVPAAALVPLAGLTVLALLLSVTFIYKAAVSFNSGQLIGGILFTVLSLTMPAAAFALVSSAFGISRSKPRSPS